MPRHRSGLPFPEVSQDPGLVDQRYAHRPVAQVGVGGNLGELVKTCQAPRSLNCSAVWSPNEPA